MLLPGGEAPAALASCAMANAGETLEETLTLLHIAESIVARTSSAAALRAVASEPLPALELLTNALAPAPSLALSHFGLLLRDSLHCAACGGREGGALGGDYTCLLQHINAFELCDAVQWLAAAL